MKKTLMRWTTIAALAVVGPVGTLLGEPSPTTAPVNIDQLKVDAFKALRVGDFNRGSTLLGQAAAQSSDPQLARMHYWAREFEDQLMKFAGERHVAEGKAAANVKMLIDKGHPDFALDFATRAQLLSDDKKGFHDVPWVKQLIDDEIRQAAGDESSQQWLRALRIYSDLASLEPASKQWKEDLKTVTRRVRLLALYTPDELKKIQERDSKERDEVDALIPVESTTQRAKMATTVPMASVTTQPTTKPGENTLVDNDNFKVDWRETLHGVSMPMLVSAMHDAAINYYRDITYKQLVQGGLNGLLAIATTPGLEKAFPGLSDNAAKAQFNAFLTEQIANSSNANEDSEQGALDELLSNEKDGLLAVNARTVKIPEQVLVAEFADGALGGLDPFSSMIWPSDLEEFNKTTQGEFSGVGVQIQLDDDGSLKVVSPLEDTPAYKAGIKSGDIIAKINGKDAKGISLNQAVRTITGPSGTTVELTMRSPDSHLHDYVIRRETIKVASVKGYVHKPGGGWDYYVDPSNKIAYLRITNFTKTSGEEMDKALADLDNHENGLILDLRGNPGGLLTAATDVSNKFLKNGVIVSTRADRETPNAPTVATARAEDTVYEKPLVVLVNQYSASASEIVSGALKDDHRAILVGERTFGKGSVQMLFPLASRTAYLKLTTSHYYLPSGRCIHREENSTEWGVDPDVTVEMTPEQMRAALDARQNMDVLRDANSAPAEGKDKKMADVAPIVTDSRTGAVDTSATTKPAVPDLLKTDPQLSAALLVLRLESVGAQL